MQQWNISLHLTIVTSPHLRAIASSASSERPSILPSAERSKEGGRRPFDASSMRIACSCNFRFLMYMIRTNRPKSSTAITNSMSCHTVEFIDLAWNTNLNASTIGPNLNFKLRLGFKYGVNNY